MQNKVIIMQNCKDLVETEWEKANIKVVVKFGSISTKSIKFSVKTETAVTLK